jgi:UDP-glucose 4-epimerase
MGKGGAMRVVITGATGNIGTALTEELARDVGVTSIVGLARRPAPARRPDAGAAWPPARTELRTVDVSRDRLDEHLEGADAVVHLAWLFHPARRPTETWRNNVEGARRTIEAAARAGVGTVIYASSVGAYSPHRGDARVTESWPTDSLPTAGYGREKAYIERLLDVFERDHPDIRTVRFRPAFVFRREAAVGQRRIFAGPFLPRPPAPGARHRPLVLPDVAGLRFQALHTVDVADAIGRALRRPVHGAFNLAAEPVVDVATIAGLLGARTVAVPPVAARAALAVLHHLRLVPVPPELFDLVLTLPLLDTTRAAAELDWQPRHRADHALGELLTGLHRPTGFPTPPLDPATSGPWRRHEVATGVGARADAS